MGTPPQPYHPRSARTFPRTMELGVAGGAAFWVTNFITSLIPIAAEYRAELSISYALMVLVESLVGGLIIGCFVGYATLRLSDRVLTKAPILRSVAFSLIALAIIQTFATILDRGYPPFYILLGAALNVPRFLALGLVVGVLDSNFADRSSGPQRSDSTHSA